MILLNLIIVKPLIGSMFSKSIKQNKMYIFMLIK